MFLSAAVTLDFQIWFGILVTSTRCRKTKKKKGFLIPVSVQCGTERAKRASLGTEKTEIGEARGQDGPLPENHVWSVLYTRFFVSVIAPVTGACQAASFWGRAAHGMVDAVNHESTAANKPSLPCDTLCFEWQQLTKLHGTGCFMYSIEK